MAFLFSVLSFTRFLVVVHFLTILFSPPFYASFKTEHLKDNHLSLFIITDVSRASLAFRPPVSPLHRPSLMQVSIVSILISRCSKWYTPYTSSGEYSSRAIFRRAQAFSLFGSCEKMSISKTSIISTVHRNAASTACARASQ